MSRTIAIVLRYLMKRKDCLLRFLYRVKAQLVKSVNGPITFVVKKRLRHVAGQQEMEKSENENIVDYVDDYASDMSPAGPDFEFHSVQMENDDARVAPLTADTENQTNADEDWENDALVDPFPFNNMNSELDCPSFEQLSVQPVNGEEIAAWTCTTELCTSPDTCARGTLRFNLVIENMSAFLSQRSKVTSDQFMCRDIPFCLIVQNSTTLTSLDVFLMRVETNNESHDHGLEIVAGCEVGVINQITNKAISNSFSNHLFRAGTDWGFTQWLDIGNLKTAGTLYNNSVKISVLIRAEPPFCYSHHSKAITGCVGIRNQGATCYMNSLLQVLFHLTKFRTACYRIPTEMDDSSSMALSLQKVFYNLQFSDTSVCTKNLTKSFGWTSAEVLTQHDIQEMMRVLIDKVESRMKNTLLEPILPSIFQGKFVSYVKCRDIHYSSQREEVFYDIQLSLDNSSNVYESFRRYILPEMMDDENKYDAGTHGLQAAEKGTFFTSLPPVLFLHLLRFQFDGTTNQVQKNNNYFAFYEHIDLTKFFREDEATSWKYTLFAVLSHSGSGNQGHYVAHINPSLKGQWLKFDDDTISLVHKNDAVEANFGCINEADEWVKSMQFSAYMLVYVRDNMADDIFAPTDPQYITEELRNAVKQDAVQLHSNNYMRRCHYTTDIYVFLDTFLELEYRFGCGRAERSLEMPKFPVTRDSTVNDFKAELQRVFKVSDANQMRIWAISFMQNPAHPVYMIEDELFVNALSEVRIKYVAYATVWVEMALPGTALPPFDPDKDAVVFYHYFCAEQCRPYYVDHGYHAKDSIIAELIPILNQLMGWSNRELNIYQVRGESKIEELNLSSKFSDNARLACGTYAMHIVFEPKEHDTSHKLNSIALYYEDLMFRVNLTIQNVDNPRMEEDVEISLRSAFPELLDVLATRLNYDAKKIQIFNSHKNGKGKSIPCCATEPLQALLLDCTFQRIKLFYKLHVVDVIDVETKHNFTFVWLPIDMKKHEMVTIYLSDDETIDSIIEQAKSVVTPNQPPGSGIYRLLGVHDHRLFVARNVKDIYDYIEQDERPTKTKYYRIEEIPNGDEVLNENEKYVQVIQSRQPPRSPGPSFIIKVDMSESWQSAKNRVKLRLNLSETNWSDCQLSVYNDHEDQEIDVDDAQCLNDCLELPSTFYIWLKHKSKAKRSSYNLDLSL